MAALALAAAGSALAGSAAISAGAVAGGFLATGAAALGGAIGSTVGGFIDNAIFGSTQRLPDVVGPRLADTGIQVSTYGTMIPIIYGRVRLAGNVIWSSGITEVRVENTTEQSTGGKGGGGSVSQTSVNYEYYVTLAIAVCEGEIDSITRVWADSLALSEDILQSANDKYNIYLGSETQTADPIIEAYEGAGNAPGYRGLAYVVIKDFPLAQYGNRIPNFTFEIVREVKRSPSVEDLVKNLVLIPGSGEFVYDTDIVTKQAGALLAGSQWAAAGEEVNINMHNFEGIADVKKALDDAQSTFPNLESILLVVGIFSTSKFLATSSVIPKIEADDTNNLFSKDWYWGSIDKSNAELVTVLSNGDLNYGGTPSDESVILLLRELAARGLSVVFYPFLQIDTDGTEGGGEDAKPWRGRMVPTSSAELNTWMTKADGYNAAIMHYANLSVGGYALKDLVDKFVIGSEMVGITQYESSSGIFPGVTQFKSLAATVKSAMPGVDIGYAADWTEYHSIGGWFNMDPLWTDSNIDFIGIDYYMPLTPDLLQTSIDISTIKQYFEDGEGWAYFYSNAVARTGLTAYTPADGTSPYAWKNIEGWWKASSHTNPDMSTTAWTAKAKPIIFTEFGFPSVDGCANQPNVFVDPNSVESYYPRRSRRRVDFQAQRDAITAFLEFWQDKNAETGNSDLAAETYLWTWDARPFPQFPDLVSVWADGPNWKTGHWVNGKLGGSNLGAIVQDLLLRTGLTTSDFDTSRLTDIVDGYLNTRVMTVRGWLEQLASVYFFDMVESDGILKFIKRGGESVKTISSDDCIPTESGSAQNLIKIDRKQELELPKEVTVTFLDRVKNYQNNTQISQRQTINAIDKQLINVPIVLTAQQAKIAADVRLYNQWISRNSFQFSLSNEHIELEPTDIITLTSNGVDYSVRLTDVTIGQHGILLCQGVSEDITSYDFYTPPGQGNVTEEYGLTIPTTTAIPLDLPLLPGELDGSGGSLRFGISASNESTWSGAVMYRSDDGGENGGNTWGIVGNAVSTSVMGKIATALAPGTPGIWDTANTVDVYLQTGSLSSATELAVLNGANTCVIDGEILQFRTATVIDGNTKNYRLSNLLRGRLGTEEEAGSSHAIGSDFVLLTTNLLKVGIPFSLFGVSRYYKPVTVGSNLNNTTEQAFTYTGISYKPYSPVHLEATLNSNDWEITWVRRTRFGGELLDNIGTVPINEQEESYEIDIMDGSTVVNTYTSTTPSFTYTSAQQTADWGSNQSSIEVNIYQISAVVGRGKVANATFS